MVIDQDFTITHCSDNLHQAADYLYEALIGRPISLLNIIFGKIKDEYFINNLISLSWQGNDFKPLNPYVVLINDQHYNMIISLSGNNYILDFEPELSDLYSDPQNVIGAALSQMLADKRH